MNLFWLHTRLLIVAFIWGLGWTAGRVVATDFPPITAAWIRYIIAVAMFLVWLKMTGCLLYTSPSPRDGLLSRMPSSA